jgi:hypothetical protein
MDSILDIYTNIKHERLFQQINRADFNRNECC